MRNHDFLKDPKWWREELVTACILFPIGFLVMSFLGWAFISFVDYATARSIVSGG